MRNPITMLRDIGLGAGLMYFLDPDRGASRRAWLADQARATMNDLADEIDKGVRDLRNRSFGAVAEARSHFTADEANDQVIVDRVRSRMGRWISNPRAISVKSLEGAVTLSGPILRAEVDGLLGAVASVRGVREVIDHLEVHDEAGGHPALQAAETRPGELPEFHQANWSPATKLMLGTAGAVAGLALIRRSGLMLPALAMTGAAWALSQAEGDPLADLADRWRELGDHLDSEGGPEEASMAEQGGLI